MSKKFVLFLGLALCAGMLFFSGCSLGGGDVSPEAEQLENFTAKGGLSDASVNKMMTGLQLTLADLNEFRNTIDLTSVGGVMNGTGELFFDVVPGKAESRYTAVKFVFSDDAEADGFGGPANIKVLDLGSENEVMYSSNIEQAWRAARDGDTVRGEIFNMESGEVFVSFVATIEK